MRVSKHKPLTGSPLPWDKYPRLEPDIRFYKLEDNDKSDSGYESVIYIKIDKSSYANNQNTKKLTFQIIKSFGHQVPKVIPMLREVKVSAFEHLFITTWEGIDQRWRLFDQVLKVPVLTK